MRTVRSIGVCLVALVVVIWGPDLLERLLTHLLLLPIEPSRKALAEHWTRENYDAFVSAGGMNRIHVGHAIHSWIAVPALQVGVGFVLGLACTAGSDYVAASICFLGGLAAIRGSGATYGVVGVLVSALYAALGWAGARRGSIVRLRERKP